MWELYEEIWQEQMGYKRNTGYDFAGREVHREDFGNPISQFGWTLLPFGNEESYLVVHNKTMEEFPEDVDGEFYINGKIYEVVKSPDNKNWDVHEISYETTETKVVNLLDKTSNNFSNDSFSFKNEDIDDEINKIELELANSKAKMKYEIQEIKKRLDENEQQTKQTENVNNFAIKSNDLIDIKNKLDAFEKNFENINELKNKYDEVGEMKNTNEIEILKNISEKFKKQEEELYNLKKYQLEQERKILEQEKQIFELEKTSTINISSLQSQFNNNLLNDFNSNQKNSGEINLSVENKNIKEKTQEIKPQEEINSSSQSKTKEVNFSLYSDEMIEDKIKQYSPSSSAKKFNGTYSSYASLLINLNHYPIDYLDNFELFLKDITSDLPFFEDLFIYLNKRAYETGNSNITSYARIFFKYSSIKEEIEVIMISLAIKKALVQFINNYRSKNNRYVVSFSMVLTDHKVDIKFIRAQTNFDILNKRPVPFKIPLHKMIIDAEFNETLKFHENELWKKITPYALDHEGNTYYVCDVDFDNYKEFLVSNQNSLEKQN